MNDHHKKKQFLHLPEYPGGGEAMKEFVGRNLQYPAKALEAKVEGAVIVEYDVYDDGSVRDPHILKGLGYGCDEEAMRVVGMLRFEKVRNRGARVKVTKKTRINFRLPKAVTDLSVSYQMAPSAPKTGPGEEKEPPVKYNYTVDL
jgi:TonB family protein